MEINNDTNEPNKIEPQPLNPTAQPPLQKKKTSIWRIIWGIFTGFSILANFFLVIIIIAIVAFFTTEKGVNYSEHLIEAGPHQNKIAIINITGIIDNSMSDSISEQLKMLEKDVAVKALILRINSPGGTVSASDQINDQLKRFKQKTNLPVVAFMQSVAASGGYYTAVASDRIIAEPTAITGSIGVIMAYFVLQDLLEDKLGVLPVVIKSGEKKDWPSAFAPPTDEQKQYLNDRIILPAYSRFVDVVAQGRPLLGTETIKTLADGSIFSAPLAMEKGLIDQIGYLDDCINTAKQMANVQDAKVVEYKKVFSLTDLLSAQQESRIKLDRKTLQELSTPQLMYIWNNQ